MKPLRIFAFADEASPQIDGQIAALRRNGLQGLEIRNVDGQNVSDISLEKAREVHKKLTDAGLSVWSIGSPIGKIDIQKDNFERHLQKYLHTLEIARALGAEKLRMFSFYLPKGQDPTPFRQQVIDRLSRMAELAQGSGVALCHENEKGIYGDVASRCLEILQVVPQLQGVFDPANFVQCGQETWAAWEMLHERITYMHIKDALPDGRVVPAGAGVGDVGPHPQAPSVPRAATPSPSSLICRCSAAWRAWSARAIPAMWVPTATKATTPPLTPPAPPSRGYYK